MSKVDFFVHNRFFTARLLVVLIKTARLDLLIVEIRTLLIVEIRERATPLEVLLHELNVMNNNRILKKIFEGSFLLSHTYYSMYRQSIVIFKKFNVEFVLDISNFKLS